VAADAVRIDRLLHHQARPPGRWTGLASVARLDSQIVGFVMLSGTDLVDDDGTRREVLTLTPGAVLPEFQRRGIGSALVTAAIAEADRRRAPRVLLEGNPNYYSRLGFPVRRKPCMATAGTPGTPVAAFAGVIG
jgi:putative acetyltransferase